MGRSLFLVILLVSSFLFLSFGYGFGRALLVETVEDGDSMNGLMEHANRKMREVYEIMDYSEPEPNTNPKSGIIFSPPPTMIPASPPKA